jgi:hypothetical protein
MKLTDTLNFLNLNAQTSDADELKDGVKKIIKAEALAYGYMKTSMPTLALLLDAGPMLEHELPSGADRDVLWSAGYIAPLTSPNGLLWGMTPDTYEVYALARWMQGGGPT